MLPYSAYHWLCAHELRTTGCVPTSYVPLAVCPRAAYHWLWGCSGSKCCIGGLIGSVQMVGFDEDHNGCNGWYPLYAVH